MNSVSEDVKKPRRFTRYHLTMAVLVVTIIAVAITTIVGSTSSLARDTDAKTSIRMSVVNDEDNPPIVINCEKPVLNIALVLDRSGSVSGISTNPAKYKESVNRFLDNLSGVILSSNGEMNVLLYAFGSRTIVQNDTTPSQELITVINNNSTLDDMKEAVDKIYFSPYAKGNINSTMNASTDPYDIRRGYNAGVSTAGPIAFHLTNWDDALREVGKIGSSKYSDPAPGGHIDLALMLTDGQPNVHNGSNRTFEPSDTFAYIDAIGRDYAAQTVGNLRNGVATRPPMAVRGVLINSTATSAMNEVFGPENETWSRADNFEDDLQKVLDDIVDQIENGELCQSIFVNPTLDLDISPGNVTVDEGPNGAKTITVRVTNTSTAKKKDGTTTPCPPTACDIKNIKVSVLGTVLRTFNLEPGQSQTVTFTVSVPFGGTYDPSPDASPTVRAIGVFETSSKVKLDSSSMLKQIEEGKYEVPKLGTYSVTVERANLPA